MCLQELTGSGQHGKYPQHFLSFYFIFLSIYNLFLPEICFQCAWISTDQGPSLMMQSLDTATAFEKLGVRRISHVSKKEQSPLNLLAMLMSIWLGLLFLRFKLVEIHRIMKK